ncbi:hypothetical protein RHSIM_Rhsim05G0121000 [Rhododendron simsii]|uniref:Uncharacterized protein n=1 Tax=Rhododendron simsii TaxID=118357 RepID=A0A834GY41_RHOSS|nr:hypothetical protein RHSIM_Rhsim05G0121000 [Rhododendron simsii]
MEEEEEMIANSEKGHAKRRTAAEVRAANQKKREEGLKKRGFNNERHVDVDNLGIDNCCVRRIRDQGLSYYLAPNPGYNIEFYKNMKIPSLEDEENDDAKITSKIRRISIEVTSGFIAHLLNYHQPPVSDVNYPDEEFVNGDEMVQELFKIVFVEQVVVLPRVAIMGYMKKIKKEVWNNARTQRRINHKLDWVVSRRMGQASEPYEPPPMEPDEDSDDFACGKPEFADKE